MRRTLADCRHALHLYRRTPGTSLIAVIVLATGMAFVGAFLSLYVDLSLRPEPAFEQSGRIATAGQNGGPRLFGLPIEVIDRMAAEMASTEAVAATVPVNVLIGPERADSVTTMVTEAFFDGLRPRLALGRGILPEENRPDAEPVAVISYRLWQERFQGDPNVLDRTLELSRDPRVLWYAPTGPANAPIVPSMSAPGPEPTLFRIVGVMAEPLPAVMGANADSWIGLERAYTLFYGTPEGRRLLSPPTFVRKRPGLSADGVAAELESRYGDYEFLASNYYPGVRLDVIDGIVGDITAKRDTERQLGLFLGGSILLALVAAANVSLFLLARAPQRQRELGIRMAVGAPFGRIARQLATEAGLLVVVAAALGLLFSGWLRGYLRTLPMLRAANWGEITLFDWRVLTLSGLVVLALTLLVALTPLPGIRRLGIGAASRTTMARASPLQLLTGTGQIAAAGAIGGAAIAFAWYLGGLHFGSAGYEVRDRYLVQFARAEMSNDSRLDAYFVELARRRERILAIPGVEAVGFGSPVPGAPASFVLPVRIDLPDDPTQSVGALTGLLDTGFIDVLGLRLVHGRAPAEGDSFESSGPVLLVNQAFARAVFGRDDVVGERLDNRSPPNWSNAEIIGVLADLSFEHPSAAPEPYAFLGAHGAMGRTAVVHTSMPATDLRAALEGLTATGEIEADIRDVRPLRVVRSEIIATDRARAGLTIIAAALVLLLAAFGNYGTLRYLVTAGRREYAIRAALGAGPGALGRLVVVRAVLMSLPGLALGTMLAFIVVAWIRVDWLGGAVSPALVTVAVALALGMLLLAASLGPAREARSVQPAQLLREN